MAKLLSHLVFPALLILGFGCSDATNSDNSSDGESDKSSNTIPDTSVPLEFLPALNGGYFKFNSNALGRPFHIYVRLPPGYDSNAEHGYPVVYLLDGDSMFPILAANHRFFHFEDHIPEAIVVGIAYGSFEPEINKRDFDFSAPAMDATAGQGGAPQFHDFLKTELLPEIEKRYLTNPDKRILFGQSKGGYMVLYSAFSDPDLFWGRIASNPVLYPGRERFFGPAAAASKAGLGLIVTSGSLDRPDLRKAVLVWTEQWQERSDAPWKVATITIEGGTHSADSANSYRVGLNWLFN